MEAPIAAGLAEPDLIHAARQGNTAAWEALVREHQEPVFRLAYLILGDADDAQDIAQETFLRAYRALDRFDATRPLRPWLLRIAANLARNRRRSIGRYWAALQRNLRSAPQVSPGAEELSAQRWQAQALWQSVRQLDLKDQQVIYLRYFLDLSTAEVAQALDIAEGTVKSRLHRALSRLRVVVRRDAPDLEEGLYE